MRYCIATHAYECPFSIEKSRLLCRVRRILHPATAKGARRDYRVFWFVDEGQRQNVGMVALGKRFSANFQRAVSIVLSSGRRRNKHEDWWRVLGCPAEHGVSYCNSIREQSRTRGPRCPFGHRVPDTRLRTREEKSRWRHGDAIWPSTSRIWTMSSYVWVAARPTVLEKRRIR